MLHACVFLAQYILAFDFCSIQCHESRHQTGVLRFQSPSRNLSFSGVCLVVTTLVKARLHRRFLSQQLNAIFVAPELQLQNRTCKPLCDFSAILGNLSPRDEIQLTKHGDFE